MITHTKHWLTQEILLKICNKIHEYHKKLVKTAVKLLLIVVYKIALYSHINKTAVNSYN